MRVTDMSEQKYAGFWIRTAAFVIDSILVCALIVPLLLAVYGQAYFAGIREYFEGLISLDLARYLEAAQSRTQYSGEFLFTYVLPAIAIIMFWVYRSATPGKIILKMKIVDAKTGGRASAVQCTIRYLGYYVSCFALMLGFLWVAFDGRKQGFHDKLAGTVVIKTE